MAAGPWKVMNRAKKKIANGTMSLNSGTFRIALVKTLGATPADVSLLSEFTQVTSGNGYIAGGQALAGEVWTGADAVNDVTMKFDADDPIWTATGGNITSIKGAVIYLSGATNHALCYCTLSSSSFTLNQNSTLTIQNANTGIFELY